MKRSLLFGSDDPIIWLLQMRQYNQSVNSSYTATATYYKGNFVRSCVCVCVCVCVCAIGSPSTGSLYSQHTYRKGSLLGAWPRYSAVNDPSPPVRLRNPLAYPKISTNGTVPRI